MLFRSDRSVCAECPPRVYKASQEALPIRAGVHLWRDEPKEEAEATFSPTLLCMDNRGACKQSSAATEEVGGSQKMHPGAEIASG